MYDPHLLEFRSTYDLTGAKAARIITTIFSRLVFYTAETVFLRTEG